MFLRISESRVVAKDNKNKLFSFNLVSGKKERKFYISSSDEYLEWIEQINKAIGQEAIAKKYLQGQEIGYGQFGRVVMGKNKETN